MRKPWWVTLIAALTLSCSYACGSPAPAVSPSSSFGGTDLAWIEIGIAMDRQALPLLDLIPAHSRDPAVISAGGRIRELAGAELTALRALHTQAGLPAENPHDGMLMPGLVPPATVAAAAQLSGEAFDAVTLRELHAYLQQGLSLARSEQAAGRDPQTLRLAAKAAGTRDAELAGLLAPASPAPRP